MKLRYEVRLSVKFSDVITHDGVPELGVIQDYDHNGVDWEFTDRELHAVLSDARSIAHTKHWVVGDREVFLHPTDLRKTAQRAEIALQAVIDEHGVEQPPYM